MAHFCGFTKLIFLLLMLARIPFNETRPLKGKSQTASDLIAGNEFLKLFLEHDQFDKDYFNSDYGTEGGGGGGNGGEGIQAEFDKKSAETGRRAGGGRSLKDKGPRQNQAEGQLENSKQVVKLVTSGSKIVFLEDYDENDAILDSEARDIDLKREIFKQKPHHHRDIKPNLDEFKVVAVSVSSSSQRGTITARNRMATTTTRKTTTTTKPTTTTTSKPAMKTAKYHKSYTTSKTIVTMTPKPPTATTAVMPTQHKSSTRSDSVVGDNFINRSHKSELSIEEIEPLTMTQQQKSRTIYSRHRTFPLSSVADTLEALDSENSASTNINNVLAVPLAQAASARSTSTVTSTQYHSSQRNVSINHDSNLHASKTHKTVDDNSEHIEMASMSSQEQAQVPGVAEDQLLPFQTVIYHDTKGGRGPQSRSISYSSISQNVEDLKKWQQSGILAEARRNVSESLKPMSQLTENPSNHQPEPAKFYSQPSKMYSEPSKFYSEPSKIYSEPSKTYGEPEKFYSEPAKNYGQPSKIYSEPSKVYSQPSKVYSEPAKTYWPILTGLTTTPSSSSFITTTITPPTNSPQITTILPPANNVYQSSRRPAIVSRIAFGENHSTTTSTTTTTPPPNTTTAKSYGAHIHHNHSRTYGHHRHHPSTYTSSSMSAETANNENSSSSLSTTPSRRIVFNLDRLPYDLLNAPEPSNQQQTLLEHHKSKRPQQTLTYQQQQQQQQQHHHINPCLESAVTSLFSSSTLSAHPALQKQRQQQQHSSLSDQQHSNQNANGLPNGDLVKCVAEISHTSSSSATAALNDDENDDEVASYTTERSHTEELFSSTPEQNYKIEESASAMTNGRAHDGGGGRNSLALPTTSPIHQQQHHGFKPNRQRTRTHYTTNMNKPSEIVNGVVGGGVHGGHHFSQSSSYNTNANANVQQNNNSNNRNTNVGHTNPDYNNYDNEGDDYDGSSKNNDYENDDDNEDNNNKNRHRPNNSADGRGGPIPASNGNDDDSKVAYVVDGRNYRKYRVEEKTDDGFIVGEYGVVDHNDGNLRGVRYTADSTINRSLIHKTLLTFLNLK